MQNIVIRVSGNAIDISHDGKGALSEEVRNLLEPQLQYKHMKMVRGTDRWDKSGVSSRVKVEQRAMYTYDKYSRMVCGAGFISKVNNLLTKAGYKVEIVDINSEHPRTDRFALDWDNVVNNFKFRERQEEVLVKVASNYRGVVSAPTGFGKSFQYKAMCLLFSKARIIITTKRVDIVESIKLDLSTVIPNIGQIGGGIHKPSRITIVTADSLHKVDPEDVDIVIGEEVHELAADSYAVQLSRFKRARMYGFTATPTGRMDNADIRIESLFGPIVFNMSYPEAVKLGLVVPIKVKWIPVRGDNPASGMVDIPKKRWGLWRNEYRNQLIASAAREFDEDEQVLIMVTTFEHAVYLRQHLPEFTLCYAERGDDADFNRYLKNGMLPPDEPVMTSKRRQELRKDFTSGKLKKVIATDVWSTGVSFNGLAVMIRADARGSEIMDSQIPGRVSRLDKANNKAEGLVIDCGDEFDNGFRLAANKRKKNYIAKGWEQC
jgi:superfamily II DNA or RNA helicase